MGYLIRVTDVKVTSACNKERRSKIKLGREAFLNQKKKEKNLFEKEEKNNHEPSPGLQGAEEHLWRRS